MIKNNRYLHILVLASFLAPSALGAQQEQSLKERTLVQLKSQMRLIRLGTRAAVKKAQFKKLTESETLALSQLSKRVAIVIGLIAIIGTGSWFYFKKGPQNGPDGGPNGPGNGSGNVPPVPPVPKPTGRQDSIMDELRHKQEEREKKAAEQAKRD